MHLLLSDVYKQVLHNCMRAYSNTLVHTRTHLMRRRFVPELPGLSVFRRRCGEWQTAEAVPSCRLSRCCRCLPTGGVRWCRGHTAPTSATGGGAASCADPDPAAKRLADGAPAHLEDRLRQHGPTCACHQSARCRCCVWHSTMYSDCDLADAAPACPDRLVVAFVLASQVFPTLVTSLTRKIQDCFILFF